MCDKGHTLTFNYEGCEISKEGRSIVEASRASNNLYILNDLKSEKSCMTREDESWLWYKRLGHLSFDNLVRISRKV